MSFSYNTEVPSSLVLLTSHNILIKTVYVFSKQDFKYSEQLVFRGCIKILYLYTWQ